MLKTVLELYTAARAGDVRNPVPHLFGPPGCGKSTVVKQASQLLGVNLHTINVSRISPLELEGVQMPTDDKLKLLLSTYWSNLQEGDIVLLDEFLRGFPEVYNGMLDILTSREVAGHKLPWVFFIAASNTTVAYDRALDDRLLHLRVPDPRKSKAERSRIAAELAEAIGLMPAVVDSTEMIELLDKEILPTYKMMDDKGGMLGDSGSGFSSRNLIGQAQLRYVMSEPLATLMQANNDQAIREKKPQFVVLFSYKGKLIPVDDSYETEIKALIEKGKLAEPQAQRAHLNLQLLETNRVVKEATYASNASG